MQFDVKDTAQHSDFFTPHALINDKKRGIQWAALLRPTGVAVYLVLLHHAGYQSRTCYPSESLLARETGLSLRQVKREIKRLIAFGMITKLTPAKKTLFDDISASEKLTNTYTITDKKDWRVPADAQFKPRADKGRLRKTAQLEILDGDSQSPEAVTHSHLVGDSQSPSRCLTVTQNRSQLINPIEITPSTSTTPAATESAPKDDVVDENQVDGESVQDENASESPEQQITPEIPKDVQDIPELEDSAKQASAKKYVIYINPENVSFMENKAAWHGTAPNAEQYEQAMAELEKVGEALCQK